MVYHVSLIVSNNNSLIALFQLSLYMQGLVSIMLARHPPYHGIRRAGCGAQG
jgi:hypothetical protein